MIVIGARCSRRPRNGLMPTTSKYCPLTSYPQTGRVNSLGFQAESLDLDGGYGGKNVVGVAHVAHFRIRKKRAAAFGLQRHHPVCMRHIKWPQDQCLQDAENDDVGGDAERQDQDRGECKAGIFAKGAESETKIL